MPCIGLVKGIRVYDTQPLLEREMAQICRKPADEALFELIPILVQNFNLALNIAAFQIRLTKPPPPKQGNNAKRIFISTKKSSAEVVFRAFSQHLQTPRIFNALEASLRAIPDPSFQQIAISVLKQWKAGVRPAQSLRVAVVIVEKILNTVSVVTLVADDDGAVPDEQLIPYFPRLETLEIKFSAKTPHPIAWKRLMHCSNLTVLKLENPIITSSGMTALLVAFNELEKISIHGWINPDGPADVAELLEMIKVSHGAQLNDLSVHGIHHFDRIINDSTSQIDFSGVTSLRTLDINIQTTLPELSESRPYVPGLPLYDVARRVKPLLADIKGPKDSQLFHKIGSRGRLREAEAKKLALSSILPRTIERLTIWCHEHDVDLVFQEIIVGKYEKDLALPVLREVKLMSAMPNDLEWFRESMSPLVRMVENDGVKVAVHVGERGVSQWVPVMFIKEGGNHY